MSPSAGILGLVILIVFGLLLVVLPAVCFFLCILSNKLTAGGKFVWILVLMFTGPIGAVCYVFMEMDDPLFKKGTLILTVCLVLFLIIGKILIGTGAFNEDKDQTVQTVDINPVELGFLGVDQNQQAVFQQSVDTIKEEVRVSQTKEKSEQFLKLYNIFAKDKSIDQDEYDDWIRWFEIRQETELEAIKGHVRLIELTSD